MADAATLLQGFHDFSSFADKRMDKDASPQVQVDLVEVKERGELIVIRICASHFLWKMVRRIVGTLVEVGRGNMTANDIRGFLSRPSEMPAKFTAPPSGLYLEQVLYEGDVLEAAKLPLAIQ
jgi:tRNA pseudouridine38-40 synthase